MNCALSEVSLVGSPLDLISLKDKRIQVPYMKGQADAVLDEAERELRRHRYRGRDNAGSVGGTRQ